METISVTLTREQFAAIMVALAKFPFEQVAQIIADLQQQAANHKGE